MQNITTLLFFSPAAVRANNCIVFVVQIVLGEWLMSPCASVRGDAQNRPTAPNTAQNTAQNTTQNNSRFCSYKLTPPNLPDK
jgi:uncharacterized protein YceK